MVVVAQIGSVFDQFQFIAFGIGKIGFDFGGGFDVFVDFAFA